MFVLQFVPLWLSNLMIPELLVPKLRELPIMILMLSGTCPTCTYIAFSPLYLHTCTLAFFSCYLIYKNKRICCVKKKNGDD